MPKYKKPSVTVDIAILFEDEILLIRRRRKPFKNYWALPGGFVDINESLEQAARRELIEETDIHNIPLHQFQTYGEVKRDHRGRVISVVYVGKTHIKFSNVTAGDDAKEANWFSVSHLPKLAFDHNTIISDINAHLLLHSSR